MIGGERFGATRVVALDHGSMIDALRRATRARSRAWSTSPPDLRTSPASTSPIARIPDEVVQDTWFGVNPRYRGRRGPLRPSGPGYFRILVDRAEVPAPPRRNGPCRFLARR